MIKLGTVIEELITTNSLLNWGFHRGVLNLSQVARLIQPQVCARAKKQVQASAITMALSRLQQDKAPPSKRKLLNIELDNIAVNTGLCAANFPNTSDSHRGINSLYNKIYKKGGFITITHGVQEIRLILERTEIPALKDVVKVNPNNVHASLSSVAVSFKKNYLETPGFFFSIFQELYFQNINVIEIASTLNELIIYVDDSEVRTTFDTLYHRFINSRRSVT